MTTPIEVRSDRLGGAYTIPLWMHEHPRLMDDTANDPDAVVTVLVLDRSLRHLIMVDAATQELRDEPRSTSPRFVVESFDAEGMYERRVLQTNSEDALREWINDQPIDQTPTKGRTA